MTTQRNNAKSPGALFGHVNSTEVVEKAFFFLKELVGHVNRLYEIRCKSLSLHRLWCTTTKKV